MRLSLILLLFLSVLLIEYAMPKKSDYDMEVIHFSLIPSDDYEDYDEASREKGSKLDLHIAKRKKELFEEKRKAEKGEKGEKEKDNKTKGEVDSEEDKPIEICDGTEEQACECEMIPPEVKCINVIFEEEDGSESVLSTLDVALSVTNKKLKGFKPIVARFTNNIITSVRKNRLPEGMEESLASLHLEKNKIGYIEEGAFEGYKNLSKLDLEHNHLKTIRSKWFTGDIGKTLHQLNLRLNYIRDTEESPFKLLKNLEKLTLDGNVISLNSKTFVGLEKLTTLSMDGCMLDDLPDGIFKPLKALKVLSLRGNLFTEVPTALEDIPHLQMIDLSDTKIAEIHRLSFVGEPEITDVYLQHMPLLSAIQECAFCGLKKLKKLDFYNSSALTAIDENAFGYLEYTDDRNTELVNLRLTKTNISHLGMNLLDYDQMESIDLSGAPMNCTCDQMFLRNLKFAGGSTSNARCAYPKSMLGKYLDAAQNKELCGTRYARGYRFFFALFGAISAAILVTIGFILFNKGYRFTNIRSLPLPTLPGANSAYTNLNRHEENENCAPADGDNTPDFQPRPQMV